MDLGKIECHPLNPGKKFRAGEKELAFDILDFWRWNQSNLVENRNRGILAEFIVKQAFGIKQDTRLEWDAYDFITTDNIKVEVKSAAYLQAWEQKKFSSVTFGIAPARTRADNKFSEEVKRQADIYIFSLLHHTDQATIDAMCLDQWTFYLVLTKTLNDKLPVQKTLNLATLKKLEHEKCGFLELREKFEKMKRLIA